MSSTAPRIVVVTRCWGGDDDAATITRLCAGALAATGAVEIIALEPSGNAWTEHDSVFLVHHLPVDGAAPLRAAIARVALETGGGPPPPGAIALIDALEGSAPSAVALLKAIAPDVVVLAGPTQPADLTALLGRGVTRPRIVAIPMLGSTPLAPASQLAAILRRSDVIAATTPGETRRLADACPDVRVVPLDLALPLNRGATAQSLFGVGWFGTYVVLLRCFPERGARYRSTVTHDALRSALGDVAIAEVDGTRWRISDAINTAELPVNPTRVNLWRLMANAVATVDVRPPDRFGQEAIESMLLGTPVVVPEGSAAFEHVVAANGGLWYRNVGEVLDGAAALLDPVTRAGLSRSGRSYAEAHHGDMDGFVGRLADLVVPAPSAGGRAQPAQEIERDAVEDVGLGVRDGVVAEDVHHDR